jgi:cardiolipin synthase
MLALNTNVQQEPIMKTQKTLFTNVEAYYNDLVAELKTAETKISMMYYAFDHGEWAVRISQVLMSKAQAGVEVRLMADGYGQILDEPRHVLKNKSLMQDLTNAGVDVEIFHPSANQLENINRLHCKVCAIDDRTVFLGGSNIGDHYPTWDDSNLRIDGPLGDTFHNVYEYVRQFSKSALPAQIPDLNLSHLYGGDARVWMTVPKQRQDIRQALLNLINEAEKEIYIRTWYFLPDQEILNALRCQAERGVRAYVLLSHKTRVRPIDFANYIHCHKLAKAGGRVFRYTEKYMHAKAAWNDCGDVLFGSANLEQVALEKTFECCIAVRDHKLARDLKRAFYSDLPSCIEQTPEIYRKRPAPQKALSYACNLASAWL